jgi:hypothetical protein
VAGGLSGHPISESNSARSLPFILALAIEDALAVRAEIDLLMTQYLIVELRRQAHPAAVARPVFGFGNGDSGAAAEDHFVASEQRRFDILRHLITVEPLFRQTDLQVFDLGGDLLFGCEQVGGAVFDQYCQLGDTRLACLFRIHLRKDFGFQPLIGFALCFDFVIERLQLLFVANLIPAHPLASDIRFALGKILLELAAADRGPLRFKLKPLEFFAMTVGFATKLIHPAGDFRQRVFEFAQLPIDSLQAHQPGYIFTQSILH